MLRKLTHARPGPELHPARAGRHPGQRQHRRCRHHRQLAGRRRPGQGEGHRRLPQGPRRFKSVGALAKVKGIGKATLAHNRKDIRLGGHTKK